MRARAPRPTLSTSGAACSTPPAVHSRAKRPTPPPSACLPTGAADAAAALAAFDALASVACISAPRVTLAPTPRGRGLVATAAAEPGDRLITIDRAAALVVADTAAPAGTAAAAAAAADAAALHGDLPPLLVSAAARAEDPWFERLLALFLHSLFKAGPASLWRLYSTTLPPPHHVTALAAFSEAERRLLPPDLAAVAAADAAALESMHARLFDSKTGELRAFNLSPSPAATRTAAALLNSRCFSDDVAGAPLSLAVPLVDLANHDGEPSAEFSLDAGGTAFGLRATRALAAGEEVTISYTGLGNTKPNAALMKDYGFVVPGNGADTLRLTGGGLIDARTLTPALASARHAAAGDATALARLDVAARTLAPRAASADAGVGAAAVAAQARAAAAEARAAADAARSAAASDPEIAVPRAQAAADAWAERAALADAVVAIVEKCCG